MQRWRSGIVTMVVALSVAVGGCSTLEPSVEVRSAPPETVPLEGVVIRSGTDLTDGDLAGGDGAAGDGGLVADWAVGAPETVAVVGDSLTVSATAQIVDTFEQSGVDTVVVDGRESRRMATGGSELPSGVTAIRSVLAGHEPDLWVVALGTNDVGAGSGPERFADDVALVVDAVPADVPLVWVDVFIRDRGGDVAEANEVLRSVLGRRRAATVVADWFSAAALDGSVTADGVHLTEVGRGRFASTMLSAAFEADELP